MRSNLWSVSVLSLAVAVAPACATKKFVRTEVGNVNAKVDTLSGSLEETQERTAGTRSALASVDEKAEAAGVGAGRARRGGCGGRCGHSRSNAASTRW